MVTINEKQIKAGLEYMQSEIETAIQILSPLFPLPQEELEDMIKPKFSFWEPQGPPNKSFNPYGSKYYTNELWINPDRINNFIIGEVTGGWFYSKVNPSIFEEAKRRLDESSGKRKEFDLAAEFALLSGMCISVISKYCGFHYDKEGTSTEELCQEIESMLEPSNNPSNHFKAGRATATKKAMEIAEKLYRICEPQKFRTLTTLPAEEAAKTIILMTGIDESEFEPPFY